MVVQEDQVEEDQADKVVNLLQMVPMMEAAVDLLKNQVNVAKSHQMASVERAKNQSDLKMIHSGLTVLMDQEAALSFPEDQVAQEAQEVLVVQEALEVQDSVPFMEVPEAQVDLEETEALEVLTTVELALGAGACANPPAVLETEIAREELELLHAVLDS